MVVPRDRLLLCGIANGRIVRYGNSTRKASPPPKSQAIRTAVRALTRQPSVDPVLDLGGDIDALPPDLSREFDRYLNETFVAEPPATYRARRRSTVRR
jgi:hypothetical protein